MFVFSSEKRKKAKEKEQEKEDEIKMLKEKLAQLESKITNNDEETK